MTERPFHHGNLRAVLLERARITLRSHGADALSLRDLARQAGVSHGAPRSHFLDRQALLDALVVDGFGRLTEELRAALGGGDGFEQRFDRMARTYIAFAVRDAALVELMFAAKGDRPGEAVTGAALGLFQVLDSALGGGDERGDGDGDARDRFKFVFAASVQGVATLITARRVTAAQGDRLVEDAVAELLTSPLLARIRTGDDGPATSDGAEGPTPRRVRPVRPTPAV